MSSVLTITRALLYLRVMSFVGLVKSRLLRLKQPKYLAGALVGVAYFYFLFVRRGQAPRGGAGPGPIGGRPTPEVPTEVISLFAELAPLILLAVLVVNWAIPRRASLAFSQAEIAFLFPAPVNRRMLIHYRLLGSQFGIVFTALILTLAMGRGRGFGGHPAFHAIGWWLVLATLNLHFMGTSFVYSKLLNRSLTSGWRKVATITVAWLAVLALALWSWSALRSPSEIGSPQALFAYVAEQLHAGPLPWVLAIPKALLAPYFANTVGAFLFALGPAFIVLVAHYFWVVRTEVSFEEASILRAEKHATRVRAVQQGDWRGQAGARKAQRPPFTLRSTGRPELAFLWKNLLSTSTLFRPKVALAAAAIILAGSEWLVRSAALERVRLLTLAAFGMLLGATMLFGPLIARQDLRADLPNSDILKTYPLRGWQIVLGELLTPLSILSAVIWLCVLAGYRLLPPDLVSWLAPSMRSAVALGFVLLVPPFVAIQLLVPNAAAVIFPAWAQTAQSRTERGIEVMGQRIIFMTGQMLITALAAIPALIGGALIFFLVLWLVGFPTAVVLGCALGAIILAAQAWWAVRWLGNRFERFDLSAELRP